MQAAPRLAFGVIADIQFADAEDGYDFGGCRRRYYRNSLRLLREAVRAWAGESPPIDLVLQLGDSIDGQNARRGEAESALQQVLDVLGQLSVPVHHTWGNHELYNFSRARLVQTGLYSRPVGGSAGPADRECHAYHCSPAPRLRLVVLDAYDVSTLGTDRGSLRYRESLRVLREKNHNDDLNNPQGTPGLAGARAAESSLSGARGADSGVLKHVPHCSHVCCLSAVSAAAGGHRRCSPAHPVLPRCLWAGDVLCCLPRSIEHHAAAGEAAAAEH